MLDEERYSKSIDKHFHHKVLRLGFSYKGPTELGGLVGVKLYLQRVAVQGAKSLVDGLVG